MRLDLRVRFHELDPNGHVNHGVYLNWFETARIEAMDELGFGLEDLRSRGIHLVVTEANVRFRRPAVAGPSSIRAQGRGGTSGRSATAS